MGRAHERVLTPSDDFDWSRLRGKPLRIVYDSERKMRLWLRGACAHDCIIDLLDLSNIDYAIVTYETSEHRAFKQEHGMRVEEGATLLHMPPVYAAWMAMEYEQCAAGSPRR